MNQILDDLQDIPIASLSRNDLLMLASLVEHMQSDAGRILDFIRRKMERHEEKDGSTP